MLYPLKFTPILKPKLWGGQYIYQQLNKGNDPEALIGESWEVSTLPGDESIVSNGFLEGNTLNDLIEIYMGDLVGDKVYEKFGIELPIMVKILDARLDLSIQVHPNEAYANKHLKSHGKSEMWYVLSADKEAQVIAGFEHQSSRQHLEQAIDEGKVMDLLSICNTEVGNVFFLPPGRVHSLGKGNVVVEIQTTSDITFRFYDYNRKDDKGNTRQLHINESLDVLDYTSKKNHKISYKKQVNTFINLLECDDFTTNLLEFDKALGRDYYFLDSFVILTCTAGEFTISYEEGETVSMTRGESILLPASLREFYFTPITQDAAFIESYYDKKQ